MSWKVPDASDIATVVKAARERLLICSPFIKHYGIALVEDAIPATVRSVELWTRMDSRDWITGASDPDVVLEFLQRHAGKRQVRLYTSNVLHAKLLLADDVLAGVGSGNLTRGGWSDNIEIVRVVEPPEIVEVLGYAEETRRLLSPTSLAEYGAFVGQCLTMADQKEALLDLVREVAPVPPPGPAPLIPLSEFIRWCSAQPGFAAEEVVKIHKNVDQTNRQGHIKQAFYGAQRFFQEFPEHLSYLRSQAPDQPFELDESPMIGDWIAFLQQFQNERDSNYDYDIGTLVRILPESLGGIVIGGGGGGYPLKLVFPLVARRMAP
ncbi:MAG: hypothetical protein A2148_00840 [Chloroflexi bacterium RBG_16_68_14]|nr:MAG: hypothetical protein A2148_00840 [Chloroflexi bacterium RBG_16_68_14]